MSPVAHLETLLSGLGGLIGLVMAASPVIAGDVQRPVDREALDRTLSLSLEDAVFTALESNNELAVHKLERAVAGAFEQIERSLYDPEVFSDVGYAREAATETARATEEAFSVEGSEASGSVGVRQRIPIGMEISAAAEVQGTDSNRTPTNVRTRLGLSLTQQLLRGLGPRVNLAGIRMAELDARASRYELKAFAAMFVADVETAYWRYVAATETVAVVEKALKVAELKLAAVASRIEVGALPENDRAAALSEVSARKQALIDAVSRCYLERSRLLAKVFADAPIHRVEELTATSRLDAGAHVALAPGPSVALARRSRPEITEAEMRRQRGDLEIVMTRSGRLPRLELFLQLGKTGYADAFTGSLRDIPGPSYDAFVGLRFSHGIGNREAEAREKIAKATREQADRAIANLRAIVQQEVLAAVNEVERAHEQIAASGETVRFREQALLAEQARYEVGSGTMLAVTLAERDLLESRLDVINARVAYRIAKIRFYLAEGTLLEHRGITLDDF